MTTLSGGHQFDNDGSIAIPTSWKALNVIACLALLWVTQSVSVRILDVLLGTAILTMYLLLLSCMCCMHLI
jgi:hypothetical protein